MCRKGLYIVIEFRRSAKLLLIALSLLIFSGCTTKPVFTAVKCDLPTYSEPTLNALAVLAIEQRQALEECNQRNGF